jgi:hypothetical protein
LWAIIACHGVLVSAQMAVYDATASGADRQGAERNQMSCGEDKHFSTVHSAIVPKEEVIASESVVHVTARHSFLSKSDPDHIFCVSSTILLNQ